MNIIFSTVRFIAKDDETFLPWAKGRFACIIFNFHTEHTPTGIEKTTQAISHILDCAASHGGTFYLTYQHVADKQQVLACYPEFNKFLALKLQYDPDELFQSDWYRWYRQIFA